MPLDPSQLINNIKKSFNVHVVAVIDGATINFDDDSFNTTGLESWYSIRYSDLNSSSPGMGDIIDSDGSRGLAHSLKGEIGAWIRGDPQHVGLGAMIDNIVSICEQGSFDFLDFTDPENPEEIGIIKIKPGRGSFVPSRVRANAIGGGNEEPRDEGDINGFKLEFELSVISEVDEK
jgi:hypothetical protein